MNFQNEINRVKIKYEHLQEDDFANAERMAHTNMSSKTLAELRLTEDGIFINGKFDLLFTEIFIRDFDYYCNRV